MRIFSISEPWPGCYKYIDKYLKTNRRSPKKNGSLFIRSQHQDIISFFKPAGHVFRKAFFVCYVEYLPDRSSGILTGESESRSREVEIGYFFLIPVNDCRRPVLTDYAKPYRTRTQSCSYQDENNSFRFPCVYSQEQSWTRNPDGRLRKFPHLKKY